MIQQSFVQMDIDTTHTFPSEYIAIPTGYVYPSEYIAMPTEYVYPSEYIAMPTAIIPVASVKPTMPSNSHSPLIQIETDPIKTKILENSQPSYTEQPIIRRRIRQREVYSENEPLIQVETHH
jgi:hypothetical protein